MIPLFPIDEVCLVFRKACLDTFGEHVIHYKEFLEFKHRHDFVGDVLFDIFRRVKVSVNKEALMNFLTGPQEGRSTIKLVDVLVYEWVGGKHACVDLIGIFPPVGLEI